MSHEKFPVCSHNGKIIPIEEAQISVQNIEFSYGFGVYETIRIADGTPLFLDDHCKRLMHSASVIGRKHPFDANQITEWIKELTQDIKEERYNVKMLLIGSPEPERVQLFILPLMPRFPDKRLYKKGADVITVEYERPFPTAKTLSMLPSYIAYHKAAGKGCYEALSVHKDGNIAEGTRSNFLAIKNGAILTPPKEKMLSGITWEHLLEIAKEEGVDVHEQDIPLASIHELDGAILTSSSGKVMPIRKIDETELPEIPEVTRTLMEKYDELLASK